MSEYIAAHLNLALQSEKNVTHESSHLTNIKDGKLIDKSLLNWTKKGWVKEKLVDDCTRHYCDTLSSNILK